MAFLGVDYEQDPCPHGANVLEGETGRQKYINDSLCNRISERGKRSHK